ncbi:MAG: BatA domain-containing protein [Clostridia bacterium]|nr:BatA domain-containing protein [Clostridia bacterium]
MALLRVGGVNPGKRRDELLSNYDGEEPYMPGGYDTPYDGEEPYMPNEYASDYDDEDDGYDDDGYDDGYRGDDDDGYDDGYRRGRSRYDDDYGYDDDEDYDEDGDYDRPPYYDAPNYDPDRDNPPDGLMRFLDENDWPTWVLLVLLPPVGIWLLWRRRRYSDGVNILLTALSAIWFVAVIYVLVARPFRRTSDTTITPQPVGVGAAPTETPEPEPEAPAEEAVAEVVPTEEVDELNAVYTVEGGPYYHQTQDCVAIGEGVEAQRVSRNSAIEASLMACPYCMGGQYSDGAFDLVFVNADTEDRSNIRVWCSAYNGSYHVKEDCSDMGGSAFEVSLKDALLMAKTACQTCCPRAGIDVFCTVDGTYYHINDECSGMRNASHVTYAEARVTGKKRCPVCIGGEDETEALPETEGDAAAEEQASGYYVYATPNGTYYHVNSTCSGMQNAQQVLLADMLKENRPACPKCCPNAESTVFAEKGNPYFHSYATCSGMTNATQGILVNALVAGLTRCPECWTADGQAAVSDGP